MDSVEEELWNIFTYYSLHGNPRDPSKLPCFHFLKLCRDAMVMDHTMTDRPLTQADIQLICTAELSVKARKVGVQSNNSDRLDYNQYLSCLVRVARKAYPHCHTAEDAMQQLLMDNILPLASRRKPVTVHSFMQQPQVESLFHYYEDALLETYKFYSASSDTKSRNMVQSLGAAVRTFDDHKSDKEGSKEKSKGIHMNYADFLRFAGDFGLTSSLALTALDLGDIYMTVISAQNFTATVRSLTFREFWETLVRSAMTAFRANKTISTEDKLKGMFLYIWRHIQETMADQLNGKDMVEKSAFQVGKGGLLRGSKILNDKFIAAWNKDGFKDYLQEESTAPSGNRHNNSSGGGGKAEQGSGSRLLKMLTAVGNGELDTDDPPPPPAPGGAPGKRDEGPRIKVNIEDNDYVGDERIQPSQLRRLLQNRPDLTKLLYSCIEEEGLLNCQRPDAEAEQNEY